MEIPACAGMTVVSVGMTVVGVGMMVVSVGMTVVVVGMAVRKSTCFVLGLKKVALFKNPGICSIAVNRYFNQAIVFRFIHVGDLAIAKQAS